VRLYRSGEGFDPRGVENVAFSIDKSGLDHDGAMTFYRDVGEGLSHVPGVRSVSFALVVPFNQRVWDEDFAAARTQPAHDIDLNAVGPDYFQAMRIPMLEGRDFRWNDTKDTGLKIILNQTAAKLLFPQEDPLGQMVYKSDGPIAPHVPYEVIGVVGDAKYENLREPVPATGYAAMMQQDDRRSPSYFAVVRTDGDAGSVATAARTLAQRLAPGIPAPTMTSMMTTVDDSLSAERMMALLSVFFCGVCPAGDRDRAVWNAGLRDRAQDQRDWHPHGSGRAAGAGGGAGVQPECAGGGCRNDGGADRGAAGVKGAGEFPLWDDSAGSVGAHRIGDSAGVDCQRGFPAPGIAGGADRSDGGDFAASRGSGVPTSQNSRFLAPGPNVENLSSFPRTVLKCCPSFHSTSTTITSIIFGRFTLSIWYF
jgi:hypothetical protein